MTSQEFVEKIESACGPNRELDLEIWRLINGDETLPDKMPQYTGSMDDAMMVSPGDWYLQELRQLPDLWVAVMATVDEAHRVEAEAMTAPLAIVKAALHAESIQVFNN